MPIRLVRLTFVRRKDGLVLLVSSKGHCVLAVRFQPLVKLILIEDVAFSWFRCRYRPITEFHVQRSYRDARVLSRFLHRHRLVAVLTYLMFPVLFLLLHQQGSQAHHLIPKLGDDLREVVECKFLFFHVFSRSLVRDRRQRTGMTHPCRWKLTVTTESSHYNLKRHDYRRLLESKGITNGMIIAIKDNNEPKKNHPNLKESSRIMFTFARSNTFIQWEYSLYHTCRYVSHGLRMMACQRVSAVHCHM